jgi:hypothetical protein
MVFRRIRSKTGSANEVTAEGVVHSSWCASSSTTEIDGIIRSQTDTYEVKVAVEGLSELLRAKPKVKVIEKGLHLDPDVWRRGDRIVVIYDRIKLKECRIVDSETEQM